MNGTCTSIHCTIAKWRHHFLDLEMNCSALISQWTHCPPKPYLRDDLITGAAQPSDIVHHQQLKIRFNHRGAHHNLIIDFPFIGVGTEAKREVRC
ncbi:hypothetical protein CDAR_468601 [Caerostris darwini]|uniref:Uncharacterized protein n=1 Tax=Caerostris darwini TaxID=1538125 RepID=A0AAV4Q1Y2_9ARAC|nr:hypothetical protein CDAR_468601 [Caerostris darwini]